jgi:hypothetical protein
MGEVQELLNKMSPHFPAQLGSLKVYGDWFGGREDSIHTVLEGHVDEAGNFVLQFREGERLIVSNPKGCTFEPKTARGPWLRIERATRVRWEWYYYGRPRQPDNLFVEEHWISGTDVEASSTFHWHEQRFSPTLLEPAVEFR